MTGEAARSSRLVIRRRRKKPASPVQGEPAVAAASSSGSASVTLAQSEPDTGQESEGADVSSDALLVVARVLRAHGTQGELSCEIVTEFPQRFRRTKRVFLTPPAGPGRGEPMAGAASKAFAVTRARIATHRGHHEVILSLDQIADRDGAEAFRGWLVQVPETEAWKLPRGRYYWHQIVGLRVVTSEGEQIGTVSEILETGANDVYVVKGDGGERLIPAIKQVVNEIAPERGEMIVTLIPGM
jgi:16S rRNA processing protein RimM